jgi:hypothetical protein
VTRAASTIKSMAAKPPTKYRERDMMDSWKVDEPPAAAAMPTLQPHVGQVLKSPSNRSQTWLMSVSAGGVASPADARLVSGSGGLDALRAQPRPEGRVLPLWRKASRLLPALTSRRGHVPSSAAPPARAPADAVCRRARWPGS